MAGVGGKESRVPTACASSDRRYAGCASSGSQCRTPRRNPDPQQHSKPSGTAPASARRAQAPPTRREDRQPRVPHAGWLYGGY